MKQPLHVIHVEDSEQDCELIQHLLSREGLRCEVKRVETQPQLIDSLTNNECDLILSDYTLPDFNGLKALEIASAL
jgi:CheY-like chemotaxis protein